LQGGCGDFLKLFGFWVLKLWKLLGLEDNGWVPPLIIFYQQTPQNALFHVQRLGHIAYWLWAILQAEQTKRGFLIYCSALLPIVF
jgi:hypothetical protein